MLRTNHIQSADATATPPTPGLGIAIGQLVIALAGKAIPDSPRGVLREACDLLPSGDAP